MNKIKKFSFFIKESVSIDDDMVQDIKDLGYDVQIADAYSKDIDSLRNNDVYSETRNIKNEIKVSKILIDKDVDNDEYKPELLSDYISRTKELLDTLELLETRLGSEILIVPQEKMSLYLSDHVSEIDNSHIIEDLKQIKSYIESKIKNKDFRYDVVLDEENLSVSIMNIFDDASKLQPIFKTNTFKNLNNTAKTIRFEKRSYRHQAEGANYATLRYKLVSRIDNN